ncbi:Putrescine oxidase [Rubripirellula lacrimiformis]|uniref:Putrescine oxidase n=1 Tax=Rubripirellula lacrimiformis TaxID=1930273 RepID=A0A517N596_9BACT|nr:NAD(P)/FAD-dependent oxidoreductase [Rubripirellula lacrimiformis]QDT02306.1 Putrescine oxidase [Rubripirellula lacrimiformis]
MDQYEPTDIESLDIVIIGAGLAGLSCGVVLGEAGRHVTILEATDRIGGRLRSDVVDGFTLDHGFQVLLTAYPACQRMLDYDALRLRRFEPGALIRHGGRFHPLSDPWRRPMQSIATAMNPVGSILDKLRIAKVRTQACSGTLEDLYQRNDQPTIDYLRQAGFSESMIDQFFRPFIGGVFLDESLSESSRLFEFVFRMFSSGDVAVPADGMAAIPRQLADRLPRGSMRANTSVTQIDGNLIRLSDRTTIRANQIIVATESTAAARLIGSDQIDTPWNHTTNLYYAADQSPEKRRMLMLRGDETGPIQTATVISDVAKEYSPAGKSLISISLGTSDTDVDRTDLDAVDAAVRSQLRGWFGSEVDRWQRIAVYQVPYALPNRQLDPVVRSVQATDYGGPDGIWVCGDHCETPSIQGAIHSGIRVAESILENRS